MRRIELLASDWKSEVLPLYDTRTIQTILHSIIKTLIKFGGGGKIRTFEDRSQRVYSPPHLTALEPLLWGSVPLFNKASNNMRFIYFIYANATRDLISKY